MGKRNKDFTKSPTKKEIWMVLNAHVEAGEEAGFVSVKIKNSKKQTVYQLSQTVRPLKKAEGNADFLFKLPPNCTYELSRSGDVKASTKMLP